MPKWNHVPRIACFEGGICRKQKTEFRGRNSAERSSSRNLENPKYAFSMKIIMSDA